MKRQINEIGADLKGKVHLFKNTGINNPIIAGWWGHANIKGESRFDSYYIHLIERDKISSGQNSKAEFKLKFSDLEKFNLTVSIGQIIELRAGSKVMGEFRIEEIINKDLKSNLLNK